MTSIIDPKLGCGTSMSPLYNYRIDYEDSMVLSLQSEYIDIDNMVWDDINSGIQGSIVGAIRNTSRRGLSFDGIDDYVNCGNNSSLNLDDKLTISIWCELQTDSNWHGILSKGYSYRLAITPTNLLSFYVSDGVNAIDKNVDISSYSGEWYNVVMTVDPSTNPQMNCYINNDLKITGYNALFTGCQTLANSLYVGRDSGTGRYFDDNINDVRIYNSSLSNNERTINYNSIKEFYQ